MGKKFDDTKEFIVENVSLFPLANLEATIITQAL